MLRELSIRNFAIIDDLDIRTFDLHDYRQHRGIVSQTPFLFAGTVADNIRFGLTEATDEAPGAVAAIDQLAYVVFIHILREELAAGRVRGPLEALSDPQLGPVLNAIHEAPGAPHAVEMGRETASVCVFRTLGA